MCLLHHPGCFRTMRLTCLKNNINTAANVNPILNHKKLPPKNNLSAQRLNMSTELASKVYTRFKVI
eukprot:2373720-Amphidinium_carterae.1